MMKTSKRTSHLSIRKVIKFALVGIVLLFIASVPIAKYLPTQSFPLQISSRNMLSTASNESKKGSAPQSNKLQDNSSIKHSNSIQNPINESQKWRKDKSRKYSSSVRCIGPEQNRSCLYKNLYFEKGNWYLFRVGKDANVSFPYGSVVHGYFCFFNRVENMGIDAPVIPKVRNFRSEESILGYISRRDRFSMMPGLTVMIGDPYVKNIGHALFDGLYPIFLSLVRFKRHRQQFDTVFHPLKSTYDLSHATIFRRFSGGRLHWLPDLTAASEQRGALFMFEEFVMGSGGMCQRCVNPRYELPGGYELDGARLFRDRMYHYFNLLSPVRRASSMDERRDGAALRGVVVMNKRFTASHLAAIDSVMRRVHDAASPLNLQLSLVDFAAHPGQNRYGRVDLLSKDHLPLEAHLRLLSASDMYISAPGTAIMYVPFMPDGSVLVALGAYGKINQWHGVAAGFMEQYVAAGCPYLRAVMYPIHRLQEGLDADVLYGLVAQAAALIRSDFAMPVDQDATSSLAPDGRLFREMCARDADFCRAATDRMRGWDECNSFWVEEFVAEGGHWAPGQSCSRRFNHTLLRELKVKYGLSGQEAGAAGAMGNLSVGVLDSFSGSLSHGEEEPAVDSEADDDSTPRGHDDDALARGRVADAAAAPRESRDSLSVRIRPRRRRAPSTTRTEGAAGATGKGNDGLSLAAGVALGDNKSSKRHLSRQRGTKSGQAES
jgi:hypothetical protein